VPPERRDPATRGEERAEGSVRVTGLLRITEPGGGFLRSNDPAADRWYSRDVAAIAARRGLGGTAPFFLDAEAAAGPGRYPVGGLTVVSFPDNHLVYALTWFGLALLALGGAVTVFRHGRAEAAG
jgi:surfeit locus 1 family protein